MLKPLAAIVIAFTLAACQNLDRGLGQILGSSRPTAKITNASIADLSLDHANVMLDVDVSNPYALPLPLSNITYALSSGGKEVLRGNADELQGTIPANGKRTLRIPARVGFSGLISALSNVRPGSVVPYEADVALALRIPEKYRDAARAAGAADNGLLSLPLKTRGELPVPALPTVSFEGIDLADITKGVANVKLKIGNTNAFPIDIAGLDASLNTPTGDAPLRLDLKDTPTIRAKDMRTISLPIHLDWKGLSNLTSARSITGQMKLNTPYAPLTVPLNATR